MPLIKSTAVGMNVVNVLTDTGAHTEVPGMLISPTFPVHSIVCFRLSQTILNCRPSINTFEHTACFVWKAGVLLQCILQQQNKKKTPQR